MGASNRKTATGVRSGQGSQMSHIRKSKDSIEHCESQKTAMSLSERMRRIASVVDALEPIIEVALRAKYGLAK